MPRDMVTGILQPGDMAILQPGDMAMSGDKSQPRDMAALQGIQVIA